MKKPLFGHSPLIVAILFAGLLLGACTRLLPNSSQPDNVLTGNSGSTEPGQVTTNSSAGAEGVQTQAAGQNSGADDFDPFRIAIETALEAADLNDTAETSEEWRMVAEKWQQAIELMKAVPKSHEQYDVAQQRALEAYPTNLAYAQGKAGEDALPEFTTEDDKMTKVDFGEGWPFVVDGEIMCERISAGEYVVDLVTLQSLGQVYAVNLPAQSRAQDRNWRNIDEIWRDSPIGDGKVPINWVIWRGEALCDAPLES
ncbi:MAG: hypothetical protein F6K30_02670 [Cyanothece sp. SIO2G6]|nr:hypothetical protein [Cyanothece sp. SIO2G6]